MRKNYNDLTLKFLKKHGYEVERVERFNAFTKRRHDAFGIIDYLALKEKEILGVQSTGCNGKLNHKKTILNNVLTKIWLEAGGKLLLLSWEKKGHKYISDCIFFTMEDGAVTSQKIVLDN